MIVMCTVYAADVNIMRCGFAYLGQNNVLFLCDFIIIIIINIDRKKYVIIIICYARDSTCVIYYIILFYYLSCAAPAAAHNCINARTNYGVLRCKYIILYYNILSFTPPLISLFISPLTPVRRQTVLCIKKRLFIYSTPTTPPPLPATPGVRN